MSRPERDQEASDPLARLLEGVRARDPKALEAFVSAVGPSVLSAVRRILGPGCPEVEDVVQEALIAAIEALAGFRGGSSILHFVWRVATLTAISTRRRLRLRQELLSTADSVEGYPSPGPSPLGMTAAARRREVFLELLEDLPDAQSEALVLHCVLGCTVAEVAAATGVPLNTVRSRLQAAKSALRQRLADPDLWERVQGVS